MSKDPKLTYFGSVNDGEIKLPKRLREEVKGHFEGKQIEVVFKRKRKRRSSPQNSYLWGVCYQMITDYLNMEGDEKYTTEEVHSLMGYSFLLQDVIDQNTGEPLGKKIQSTTELTTTEMMDYIASIQKWAAETLHIVIPDPNEQVEAF